MAATAPDQKTFPITAASCSRLLRSGGSVSSRAAISACSESGKAISTLSAQPPVRVEQVAVAQHADELLGVQRVPARPLEQQLLRLGRQHRLLEQRGHELGGIGVGER